MSEDGDEVVMLLGMEWNLREGSPALRPVTIYCANPQATRIPKPTPADYTKVRCVPRFRAGNLPSSLGQPHSADKNSIKHTTMRVLLFQIIAPGIPLPPQPVLTRWGTWLDAVNYYAEHYGKIMVVIDALDSTDSSAVAPVKSLPSEQLLEDILFIDSNFKIVSKSIILLESSKLQLSEALNIMHKVSQTVIQNNNSLISEKVKLTNHNPSSEELTGSRQIHVEAELLHLFRIPRIPSVSFQGHQDYGNCAMLGRGDRMELSEVFV
ncbi:hypothetical protein ANN_22028 [Periplaneta americana]|uniref:Uncharacterized protein n=1 Tax=Periplaneta americana TaxID=6978 RepID=A0ABQ8S6Z9_PERAM|nr:hypothetical protein ANN_22028 [Periplaneta americana]